MELLLLLPLLLLLLLLWQRLPLLLSAAAFCSSPASEVEAAIATFTSIAVASCIPGSGVLSPHLARQAVCTHVMACIDSTQVAAVNVVCRAVVRGNVALSLFLAVYTVVLRGRSVFAASAAASAWSPRTRLPAASFSPFCVSVASCGDRHAAACFVSIIPLMLCCLKPLSMSTPLPLSSLLLQLPPQ